MRMVLLTLVALASCGPIAPELAAQRCEERARSAQGPTGGMTVGVNSNSGSFVEASIGISSDFVRGLDPNAVYDRCVFEQTGALPIRPPVLRDR